MSTTTLYETTPQTGTVSSTNLTTLYSNTTSFTTGVVSSAVFSVNGGLGVTVNPTTGNVVVSIGQAVAPTDNVQFANVTATGNLSNNYFTLANSVGTLGQVLTTNGAGTTSWTTVSSLGVVTDVSGSGAGISVSPTTGSVVVSNTGVTSIVAGTNISVSSATGAVTVNATDTNTTYNINASTTTGGANLNLTGSDATTDTVKFASGSGITVTRTDADTITITNSNPGGTGVTSIAGTTNQIIASASTGAVTLSTPQDIATTSSPTFAGLTAGQITVAITDDSTISSTSGNLILDSATNLVSTTANFYVQDDLIVNTGTVKTNSSNVVLFDTTATIVDAFGAATTIDMGASTGTTTIHHNLNAGDGVLYVKKSTNTVGVNTTAPGQELTISDGGDGYVQLGMINNERLWLVTNNVGDNLISYAVQETAGPITNRLQFDATGGDQWFNTGKLGVNNAAPAYTLDVNGTGRFTNDIIVGTEIQINGATSGSTSLIQVDGSANVNYYLPTAQGAANTVLTNDGGGNLSWALPGGGGSTFGNITVGVATDNTISTTTGDLVLASATNVLNASTLGADFEYISVDGQASLDSSTLTTTSTATVALNLTARNAMTGLVNIIQGTNVHCLNYTALRTGATTALLTTYGEMYNTTSLASFTADVSGGNLRLLVTPTSATSTVFSVVRTSLT